MNIRKSDNSEQKFLDEKLIGSFCRLGVPPNEACVMVDSIKKELKPYPKTSDVFKSASKKLFEHNRLIGLRYNLKNAIMQLGPSGHPFEEYIGDILTVKGYETRVSQIVRGACVTHEVDVIARTDSRHIMVECKFHNAPGTKSDVQVALYTHARFMDIRKADENKPEHEKAVHEQWLVTNTQCTTDAIAYARCAGLKILAWRYPSEGGLEKFIEDEKFFPVTIFPMPMQAKAFLIKNGITLVREIMQMPEERLSRDLGLKKNVVRAIQRDARLLCS